MILLPCNGLLMGFITGEITLKRTDKTLFHPRIEIHTRDLKHDLGLERYIIHRPYTRMSIYNSYESPKKSANKHPSFEEKFTDRMHWIVGVLTSVTIWILPSIRRRKVRKMRSWTIN